MIISAHQKFVCFHAVCPTFVAVPAVDSVAPRTKGGGTESFSDFIETGGVGWYDFATASSGGKEGICLENDFEISLFGKFITRRSNPSFFLLAWNLMTFFVIFELMQVMLVADDRK